MGRKTSSIRRHSARFLGIILLVFQGVILDFYLINGESGYGWYGWILTDLIVLAAWLTAMIMSYRRLQNNQSRTRQGLLKDELAFAYLAWLVYAFHIVPQTATLFRLKAHHLDEETMFFGPNMLKMSMCITPALFLCLIFAHHDSKPHTLRKFYLEKVTAAVTLDLFDSVEMLEYLFDKSEISESIEIAILVFACINVFLPVLALYELKHNKFRDNGRVASVSFKVIYVLMFMFFVNVPFLVLRLILWHQYDLDISVLLFKNGLAIVMGLIEILEFFGDERPRRCNTCSNTFARSYYKEHRTVCNDAGNGVDDIDCASKPDSICDSQGNGQPMAKTMSGNGYSADRQNTIPENDLESQPQEDVNMQPTEQSKQNNDQPLPKDDRQLTNETTAL